MHLVVLGAGSDIALEVARVFAQEEHASLYLASRDLEILQERARDLAVRYEVEAGYGRFDAMDCASHQDFYRNLDPKPDGVLVAFGYLGDQQMARSDLPELRRIVETNYLGAVSILEVIAEDFERRGHGFIVGISSVAGERGRKSNYLYGSAKAGFTAYLSGLRHRLSPRGILVTTVLAGFVNTKMTRDLSLPAILTATPRQVAMDIYRAYRNRKPVIYSRWMWRWIMLLIKALPERLFLKLPL